MMRFIVFAVSFIIYTHFAAPSVTVGDSGEFMTAAATLSLPHPPSYPLYSLMGKAFITAIPWGAVPYRINLFSAFISSLTLLCVFLISRNLLLTAAAGLGKSFFLNSLITEVFALNALLVCLVLLCMQHRKPLLAAFLVGLGVGNHQILIFFVPALAFAFWKEKTSRLVGAMLAVGLLGFSIYATLPIRARQNPPINWGEPKTLDKTWRVIRRADYGSLTLALGEQPKRSLVNTGKQTFLFADQMAMEVPWWFLLLGFGGLIIGIFRREFFYAQLMFLFLLAGPFFYLLGNLPFTAQSAGIMGRFMVWPVLLLTLGFAALISWKRPVGTVLLALFVLLVLPKRYAEGKEVRNGFLVHDYGTAMLRTLPPEAALFMDGGDDAFYSLAMFHYVMRRRPDVALHDRGGLIYRNPYGSDFRQLSREQKSSRRLGVEKTYLMNRPLFYSTMDVNVMPNEKTTQTGFLYEINSPGKRISDELIVLRGLYPLLSADEYRVRALAAFFPFMRGDQDPAFFEHAGRIGHDVDWLYSNLSHTYAYLAYQALTSGRFDQAERLYRSWLNFDSASSQANINLGVVFEKQGRRDEARAQYQKAAQQFPAAVDPVYNLAVLAWDDKDWKNAAAYFEEALRRNPSHPNAGAFLAKSLAQMGGQ